MNATILKSEIRLDSRALTCAYSVYVIELTDPKGGKYFYVGQTGDNHYFSARSPIGRLSGHLSAQRSSTQNQLHRGVEKLVLAEQQNLLASLDGDDYKIALRKAVNAFLSQSSLRMCSYAVADFDSEAPSQHEEMRRRVCQLESLVMALPENSGAQIINTKSPKSADSTAQDAALLEMIIRDFKL